jgi:DNA-binding GntR family transcriptional regulator
MSKANLVDILRSAILSGEFVPGQRLVEADLTRDYDAGRRAIRDALAALDHEGLVERVANVGARVRRISIEDAIENAEIRLMVETLCVRLASERIDEAGISALREQAEALRQSSEAGDVPGFAAATAESVRLYVAAARHGAASDTLERLRRCNARHNFRVTNQPGWLKHALRGRLAVIDAICRRDAEAAAAALEAHSKNVMAAMRKLDTGQG